MGWFAICSGALVVGIFIGIYIGAYLMSRFIDEYEDVLSGDEQIDFAAEDVEVVAGDVSRKDIWN